MKPNPKPQPARKTGASRVPMRVDHFANAKDCHVSGNAMFLLGNEDEPADIQTIFHGAQNLEISGGFFGNNAIDEAKEFYAQQLQDNDRGQVAMDDAELAEGEEHLEAEIAKFENEHAGRPGNGGQPSTAPRVGSGGLAVEHEPRVASNDPSLRSSAPGLTPNVGSNTQSVSLHTVSLLASEPTTNTNSVKNPEQLAAQPISSAGEMNSFQAEDKCTIIYSGMYYNSQDAVTIRGAGDPKELAAQADALAGETNFMFNSAGVIRTIGGSFTNYQDVILHGTTFDTYLQQEPLLEELHKRVALNALNAGGRADDIRCYPGTRLELIGRVNKWRAAQDNSVVPIFRLVGHVGIGKSAIMQTLSDSWKGQRVPHACFFFNRKDDTRNSPSPLIATLLYQLIPLYPSLAKGVVDVVSGDPLVFESKLEDQLARLIVTPLHKIQVESPTSYRKPTLLIDGLNECEADQKRSQHQILSAFDKVMAKDPCPFQLLVASRDEPQIQAAFRTMTTMFCSLYLDNIPGAEDDIRIFVNAQFDLIKRTHPFAHTITDDEWPPTEDVDSIVRKSSGQYIRAVTVMSFIMDSSSSPEISLKHLRKPKDDAAAKSAFLQVDELYIGILS